MSDARDDRERRRAARKARRDKDGESPTEPISEPLAGAPYGAPPDAAPAIPPEPAAEEESAVPLTEHLSNLPYNSDLSAAPLQPIQPLQTEPSKEALQARVECLERALSGVLGAFGIPFTPGDIYSVEPASLASRIQSQLGQMQSQLNSPTAMAAARQRQAQQAMMSSGSVVAGNINLMPIPQQMAHTGSLPAKKKDKGIVNQLVGKTNSAIDSVERFWGGGSSKSGGTVQQPQQMPGTQQLGSVPSQLGQQQMQGTQFNSYPGASMMGGQSVAQQAGGAGGTLPFGQRALGATPSAPGEVPLTMTRPQVDRRGDTPVSSDLML